MSKAVGDPRAHAPVLRAGRQDLAHVARRFGAGCRKPEGFARGEVVATFDKSRVIAHGALGGGDAGDIFEPCIRARIGWLGERRAKIRIGLRLREDVKVRFEFGVGACNLDWGSGVTCEDMSVGTVQGRVGKTVRTREKSFVREHLGDLGHVFEVSDTTHGRVNRRCGGGDRIGYFQSALIFALLVHPFEIVAHKVLVGFRVELVYSWLIFVSLEK